MNDHNWEQEINQGKRFTFGKNWSQFLSQINEEIILLAEKDLQEFFSVSNFEGLSFLDIGSGSGLHSLAAWRLGANVLSFDYDLESYNCTLELKRRYAQQADNWKVLRGSVLDRDFLIGLGSFDIVYSWGVLHHTGSMWEAIENSLIPVAESGLYYIAIYNDQGFSSRVWTRIKSIYCSSPYLVKLILLIAVGTYFESRSFLRRLLSLQNPLPFKYWKLKKQERGMSTWIDLVDWVGGFPFEVAKPEEIFDFMRARSFTLERLKTCAGGLGCNCFLFSKER